MASDAGTSDPLLEPSQQAEECPPGAVQVEGEPQPEGEQQPEESVPTAVIQFGCETVYAEEGEDAWMEVDVVRLGDCTGSASVEYYSVDASAIAGEKYKEARGTVNFLPSSSVEPIAVKILNDDKWNATLEFSLQLTNVKGATLGKYLHTCRVKIIDDDSFPTNKYAQYFEDGTQEEIPGVGLMFEFVRLCMSDPAIRWKTIACLLMDQLKGLNFFLTMWLQLYMIDTVLLTEHGAEGHEAHEGHHHGGFSLMLHTLLVPGSRRQTAMVVAAVYILPFFVIHFTDYCMCYIGLSGAIRKMLQANLLRKYLNYNEEVRPTLALSQIQMAMVRDVKEVVDMGYMKLLALVRIIGKLLFALVFIMAESPVGSVPLLVCPAILGVFLCLREAKTVRVTEAQAHAQDSVVQQVTEGVQNYRLISDFAMRPQVVDKYESAIEHLNAKESKALGMLVNNASLAPMLTTVLIGVYLVYAATMFAQGTLGSIGLVVTTINVFKEVGVEIHEICMELIEIQRTFEPLTKIATFMNLQTDVAERRRLNRLRRKRGKFEQVALKKENMDSFAVDSMPITLSNLTFGFNGEPPILKDVTESFDQGKIYAFVGPPHEGKGTVMRLLGHVFLPHEGGGEVFVPPHLRILHLHNDNLIMHGNLMQNLTLGQSMERVGGKERVRSICELLGLEPKLLEHLEDEDSKGWHTLITDTASSRLSLARALIMNAEVMVMHKPTASFSSVEAKSILELLRKHVEEKGLALPEADRAIRRPRTIFLTSNDDEYVKGADACYRVSQKDGVKLML